MQNTVCRTGLAAAIMLVGLNGVSAQMIGPTPSVSSMPTEVFNAAPAFKWDYRFDAQYNSTIKPYLRWYNRAGSRTPKNGVRYPYYLGPQPYHGGGSNVGGCNACGQSGYTPTYAQPRRSSWFNPYAHMNNGVPAYQQSVPTVVQPSGLPFLSKAEPTDNGSRPNTPPSRTRTAWVKLETSTNSTSILYQQPVESAADSFTQAEVTTQKGKLTGIKWIEEPPGQLSNVFAKYTE